MEGVRPGPLDPQAPRTRSQGSPRVEAGTVWVNRHREMRLDTPFAGEKQSGVGPSWAKRGFEEFTQATIINRTR